MISKIHRQCFIKADFKVNKYVLSMFRQYLSIGQANHTKLETESILHNETVILLYDWKCKYEIFLGRMDIAMEIVSRFSAEQF